jgi:hypothetical protein
VITRPLPRAPELFEPEFDVKAAPEDEAADEASEKKIQKRKKPRRGKKGAHLIERKLRQWAANVGDWILPRAHAQSKSGSAAVVLRWEAVSDVSGYVIQVSEDKRFSKVVKESKIDQNFFRFSPPSLEREYWFRVKSIDKDGREGEFSKPRKVPAGTRAPTQLSPPSGRTMSWRDKKPSIKLRWAGSPVAVRYELEISRSPTFKKMLIKERVKGDPTYSFAPPEVGTYHWRVRMVDVAGTKSAYSRVAKLPVALASPDPLQPRPNGRVSLGPGQPLALRWSKRDGTGYEVQVSRRRDFRGKPLRRLTQKTRIEIPLGEDGSWYWRIRAFDSKKAPTPWSKAARFVIALPRIAGQTPDNDAQLKSRRHQLQVALEWSGVDGATAYRVEMQRQKKDGTPEQLVRKFDSPKGVVEKIEAGTWSWRVTALTPKGPVGPSPERRFVLERLAPLEAPQLVGPASDARYDNAGQVDLKWEAVVGAATYEVQVQVGEAPEKLSAKKLTAALQSQIGWTRWQVVALDSEGVPSPPSESRRFYAGPQAAGADVELDPPLLNPGTSTTTTLRVRVLDASENPLKGPEVLAQSKGAKVGPFKKVGTGLFEAKVEIAPDAELGSVPVVVQVNPGPQQKIRLEIDRASTLFIGARAGVDYNLLDLVGPNVRGELGYRLPFAGKRMGLHLIGGYALLSRSLEDPEQSLTLSSSLHRIPASLLASWRLPLGVMDLFAGGGLRLETYIASSEINGQAGPSEIGLLPGGEVMLGAEGRLGPGTLVGALELSYLLHRDAAFSLGGPSLGLTLGYRLDLL